MTVSLLISADKRVFTFFTEQLTSWLAVFKHLLISVSGEEL